MAADHGAGAHARGPTHVAVRTRSSDAVVRCGAELVGLSERFYGRVFAGAIVFVGLAATATLALLPMVTFSAGAPVEAAAALTSMIVLGTPLAVWRSGPLYCALRRRPLLQLGVVLPAAALVADPAMSSEFWWPSCAMLMALAVVASLPRALLYCGVVLGANLAGHLVAADLDDQDRLIALIGLWIGYPLWVAAVCILTDRFVAHLLRLSAAVAPQPSRQPPRRVQAWTTDSARTGHAEEDAVPTPPRRDHAHATSDDDPAGAVTERLTARQIQVAALLADGLRHREIAACLSISPRQVQRHIADAVRRLGLRNPYELAAVAVSEGIVPGRSTE